MFELLYISIVVLYISIVSSDIFIICRYFHAAIFSLNLWWLDDKALILSYLYIRIECECAKNKGIVKMSEELFISSSLGKESHGTAVCRGIKTPRKFRDARQVMSLSTPVSFASSSSRRLYLFRYLGPRSWDFRWR